MDSNILTMMLGVSIFLGALGVGALLWGLKTGQFDDIEKFVGSARFDSEDDLKEAVEMQKRKKRALEKKKKYQENYKSAD